MVHRFGIAIISGILMAVVLAGCKDTGQTPEPSPGPAIETPSEG